MRSPGNWRGWILLLAAAGVGLAVARGASQPLSPSAPQQARKADLRQRLTPMQFRVTQESATEPPFQNEYWNNHASGIYVDVVTGKPLFASTDKFDSGTGWPSFTRPLPASGILEKKDFSYGMARTEVRSGDSDSHLGHLFDDGPPAQGGLRYCINSAALRFIPVADLEKAGYGQYLALFGHAPADKPKTASRAPAPPGP